MNEPFDETGRLLRDSGGFLLACDDGRKLRLVLPRTPIDLVEKGVRVTGILDKETGVVDAHGVAAT
ncbi:MAG: DUF5818 domain-containing protein [Pacificimonas sp.]